jgi:hypothetical protein
VLRQADVQTTQRHYVLPDVGDARDALSRLESKLLDTKRTPDFREVYAG